MHEAFVAGYPARVCGVCYGSLLRMDLLVSISDAVRLTKGAPLAQRAIKEMASRGRELPWIDAVRFGETMRKVAGATEDAAEGLAAAAERRDPQWKGR